MTPGGGALPGAATANAPAAGAGVAVSPAATGVVVTAGAGRRPVVAAGVPPPVATAGATVPTDSRSPTTRSVAIRSCRSNSWSNGPSALAELRTDPFSVSSNRPVMRS